jgi:hypothetical protein
LKSRKIYYRRNEWPNQDAGGKSAARREKPGGKFAIK